MPLNRLVSEKRVGNKPRRRAFSHTADRMPARPIAMKKLIVTADDFGLTKRVNQGIIETHCRGIVTSTSLMANGTAFEDAVARAREAPRLGIGAHLNLTEGPTVSRPTLARSLVNGHGELRAGPMTVSRRIATGKIRLGEVELELRAQIEKILKAGIELTHLDGHKHIQLLPSVFDIVLKLAAEYGIKGIRCAVEPAGIVAAVKQVRRRGAGGVKQFGLGRALSLFAARSRGKARRAGLLTPQYFLGISQTGFLDILELSRILNNLPSGTSELMSHPGYVDEALAQTPTRLLEQRQKELAALTDPAVLDLIARNNIQLVSYRELSEPS